MQNSIGVESRRRRRARHRAVRAALAGLVALALIGCGGAPQATPLVIAPGETPPATAAGPARGASASLSREGPPVATVEGVQISRQEWADRVDLIHVRYDRARARLQDAIQAGTVDQAAAQDELLDLGARAADAPSVAVDDLVDLTLQGKLARDQGLSVTAAEVDAAQAKESADDPGFLDQLQKVTSLAGYRRSLEAETLAAELRDDILRKATAASVVQVHLSQIYIQDPTRPDESPSAGAVHAAQIVYAPNDDMEQAPGLPIDDPAWTAAQTQAEAAVALLQAITDPAARQARFRELATTESDDGTNRDGGGDLGWVTRGILIGPLGDALFEGSHTVGDVIGPVPTEIGWAVLMYLGQRASAAERVPAIQARLAAPGADFAAIAREESDGLEAAAGGDMSWIAPFEADPALEAAIADAPIGSIVGPLTLDDGIHFYRIEGRQSRPLSADQRSALEGNAFDTWYAEQRAAAERAGTIQITGPDQPSAAPDETETFHEPSDLPTD